MYVVPSYGTIKTLMSSYLAILLKTFINLLHVLLIYCIETLIVTTI
jgi:hypothetical protein